MTSAQPSTDARFDVLGIGNALVDVLSTEADDFIEHHGLVKGSMTLIDTDIAERLYAAMGPKTEMSGGSAANTLSGVASFGGRAAYIGRVQDDRLGEVFAHDLSSLGVHFTAARGRRRRPPPAGASSWSPPDAQRTMNTYLGASAALGPDDLDLDLIRRRPRSRTSRATCSTGPRPRRRFRAAATWPHDAGRKVALHPLRRVLRRTPPRRLPRAGRRRRRHPLRQRGRDHAPVRGRHVRRGRRPGARATARSPASPAARRARSSSPPTR